MTRLVRANEAPDGARTAFSVQSHFEVGSLRVLLDGRYLAAGLANGFVEGAPPAFEMKVAPLATQSLWAFYREE